MHLGDEITVRSVKECRSRAKGLTAAGHSEGESESHEPSRTNGVEAPKPTLEGEHVNILYPVPLSIASLSDEDRALLERGLVLSLDVRLMPLLILFYILNFLDRVSNILVCFLIFILCATNYVAKHSLGSASEHRSRPLSRWNTVSDMVSSLRYNIFILELIMPISVSILFVGYSEYGNEYTGCLPF